MDKLSTKLKLVRSQSMGVGMGGGGDKMPPNLRPRTNNVNNGLEQGRQASIVLLDERRLEMHIQPRLYAGELLDLVASHIQVRLPLPMNHFVFDINLHDHYSSKKKNISASPLSMTMEVTLGSN